MHASFPAGSFANASPLYPTGPKDRSEKGNALLSPTIVKSTTGRNRAAAHVPFEYTGSSYCPPPLPRHVALVVISVDATSLWKASSTRADVWGGGGMHPK